MKLNKNTIGLISFIIIVMIMISGCNSIGLKGLLVEGMSINMSGQSYFSNSTINFSNCLNYSSAPLVQFCKERDMSYFQGGFLRDSGCLDKSGEYHYYKMSYNSTTDKWIIGNETYSPKWECK